jgi:hypothetical protein
MNMIGFIRRSGYSNSFFISSVVCALSLEALFDLGKLLLSSSSLAWLGHPCHKIILLLHKNSSKSLEQAPRSPVALFKILGKRLCYLVSLAPDADYCYDCYY